MYGLIPPAAASIDTSLTKPAEAAMDHVEYVLRPSGTGTPV